MGNRYVVVFKKMDGGYITTISNPASSYEAAVEEVWSRSSLGRKDQIVETLICHIDDFMGMKTPA